MTMTLNDYLQDEASGPYTLIPESVVCEGLHVTPRTLYEWRKRGFPRPLDMPGGRIERQYHLKALRDFIEAKARASVSQMVAKSFTSGV